MGKHLLDLRAKINDLEKTLAQKRKEIQVLNERISASTSNVKLNLNKAEEKIKEDEIRLKALNEKMIFLEKTIQNRDKEIDILKEDNRIRNIQIEELKKYKSQIMEKEKDIKHLKTIIEQNNNLLNQNKKDYLQQLLSKELELEKNKELLKKQTQQFNAKEEEFGKRVQEKNSKIEKIERDLEAKTKQLNEITSKFEELESKLSDEIQLSTKLIYKIEKLMHLKGFISEKEYEKLKEKFDEKEIALNY
ncbi:MAG: hypothetical protein EU532_12185 [Promethearchaeota archaeon]|nr:MAG: hypothetical protein EU532_12185 [Candidatus Lokiarchaeota archaeon]